MVSREFIIKYGTLALILFFIFEAFFPLLYAPQDQVQTESPTPNVVSLTGSGTTFANVTRLEYVGFTSCPIDAKGDKLLSGKQGIKVAFYASSGALAIEFEPNASISSIASSVQIVCGAPMFRTAILDVDGVTLREGNKSQLLSRDMMRTFGAQSSLSGIRGFILPDEQIGSRVNVTVSGRVDNGQLYGLAVQQVVRTFEFEPTLVNSTDSDSGQAFVNSTDSDSVKVPDLEVLAENVTTDNATDEGEINASDLSELNATV